MMGPMYAIEVAETGGPEVLSHVEKPRPEPGPGQVLIRAEAIGVNFIDTYFRSGLYPRELPFVVGSEVCGVIEAIGDKTDDVKGKIADGALAFLLFNDADVLGSFLVACPIASLLALRGGLAAAAFRSILAGHVAEAHLIALDVALTLVPC